MTRDKCLDRERKTNSTTRRVDWHIYGPCLPKSDISYGTPQILDDTRMNGNMRLAISVQRSLQNADNLSQEVGD